MKKIINKFGCAFVLFAMLFSSCQGQSIQLKDCLSHFKESRIALNTYYKNNDTSLLQKSLDNIEIAMNCDETRRGAIELKISLLMLLKKYKNGCLFIDSLSDKDFKVSYERKMIYNFFLAMDYESIGDTINRNKCYNTAIENIQNYIQQENLPKDKIDERAYYDLFLTKWKILDKEQLKAAIELAKQQHPNNKDFFESLQSTFVNNGAAYSDSAGVSNK
jgi:hypothetical protein